MKILVVTHYYSPEFGAPQRRWRNLVQSFRRAGHNVVVVAPPPHYPSGVLAPDLKDEHGPGSEGWGEHGEYVIRTSFLKHREDVVSRTADHVVVCLDATRRVLTRLGHRKLKPDVVIATAPGIPSLFAGQAIATAFGVPFIAEMRDAWPDLVTHVHAKNEHAEQLQSALRMGNLRKAVSAGVKHQVHAGVTRVQQLADQVVTTTEEFARILGERGIDRPIVIRNGANTKAMKLAPPRESHGGPLRVLYFGNKGRAQGLSTLVKAAALAQQQGTPITVKIVGHGVEDALLRQLVRDLDAPVEVFPRVPASQAAKFYAWADTVVVSLRDWKPFEWTVPSKTYEILATGRHITACVRGETATIVARSGAGDVVAPGNVEALAEHFGRLAAYPELMDRGNRGRVWLEEHASSESLGKEYVRLVESVVRRARERSIPVVARERSLQLARNAAVTTEVISRHISDDPAVFAVQLARRAPKRVAKQAGILLTQLGKRVPGGYGLSALGSFIRGDSEGVRDALEQAEARSTQINQGKGPERDPQGNGSLWNVPGATALLGVTGRESRLAAEVGVLVDRTTNLERAPQSTKARALWAEGFMSGAIAELEGAKTRPERALKKRLEAELDLLTPGFDLVNDDLRRYAKKVLEGYREPSGKHIRALHILTNSLPHTQSGYTLRSHSILKAQVEAGIEVRALTRVGYPLLVGKMCARDVDVVDGVTYVRALPWALGETMVDRLRQQVRLVLDQVASFRPTVLHTTTNYTNGLVAKAVSELTGIPWVFEVRGLMEQTWAASKRTREAHEKAVNSQRYHLTAAREAELVTTADGVVTIAETMRRELGERGADASLIELVPNSVDASLFTGRVNPREARAALDLPEHGFWVGAVASLVDYEGFDTLVRAVGRLRALGEDVHVLLVGDGVSRPGLEHLAEELGIWDSCVFPGRVSRDLAPRYVQALDVVVVPRRDSPVTRNVTPLKPIEAMALGRPVVLSDLPALRELVLSADGAKVFTKDQLGTSTGELIGPAGLLTKPDDPNDLALAIRSLIHNPDTYRALLSAGDAIARERTWSVGVERYREVYSRIMQQRMNDQGGGAHGTQEP